MISLQNVMATSVLEKMSAEELGDWVIKMGFGEEVRDAFIGKSIFYRHIVQSSTKKVIITIEILNETPEKCLTHENGLGLCWL